MRTLGKLGLACLTAIAAAFAPVQAQEYPVRPVKIVSPAGAGGPADLIARLVAQNFTDQLKFPFVVDNKPGGGGDIGADAVAKSRPDGYTLLVSHSAPFAYNLHLYGKQPFDAAKDFVPVAQIAQAPMMLMVRKDLPVNSLADLVQLAKAKPGTLNFASAGNGLLPHIALEMLKQQTGMNVVHVPYKSAPAAMLAVMAGESDAVFDTLATLPNVKAGKLKAIAVTSSARSPLVPDLPTIKEQGLPDFEVLPWYGVFAPAGTDPAILTRLMAAAETMLARPEVRAGLTSIGFEPGARKGADFGSFIASEHKRWTKVIRESGATVR